MNKNKYDNKLIEWKCIICKKIFISVHPNYCPFCGTDYNKRLFGLFPQRDIRTVVYENE